MTERQAGVSSERRLSPAARAALDHFLDDMQARTGVPALALCLFDADEVRYQRTSGWRDREARLPVTEDTLFGVASVTKSFTALAVLQLAAQGRLSLTDPVATHLPLTLWRDGAGATIEHFLNHTSGLPPLPTMTLLRGPTQAGDAAAFGDAAVAAKLRSAHGAAHDVATFDGLVAWMNATVELLGPPGSVFSYSNDAFCLLGAIVERITGTPFGDYVRTAVLEPLGMTRSTFELSSVGADSDRTTLYAGDASGAVVRSPAWEDAGVMRGGGALKSTLADMRRWVRFLMCPERAPELGLRPEDLTRMATGTVWSGVGLRYGLGLVEARSPAGAVIVGHDGGLKGVASRIGWLPGATGLGYALLTNLAGVPVDLLTNAALNAVDGLPVETKAYRPGTFGARPADVARVLGTYRSGEPYGRVRLYLREGELRAALGDPAEDLPARLVGPDEIAVTGAFKEFPVTTVLDDAGAVRGVFYGSRVLLRATD